MKECYIQTVYEAIIRMRGWDPDTVTVAAGEKALIAEMVNDRLREAWEMEFWPDLMRAEQRQYRETWDAATNYATGDEVYHKTTAGAEKYYVSLADGNVGNNPETETASWSEVGDDFLRTIDLEQTGENEIGSVDLQNCIFEKDPRLYRQAARITDVIYYGDAILVNADEAPARPWLWYRPPVRKYSLTDWAEGTSYAAGDLCYYATTGRCYKALQATTGHNPESETSYWAPVDFPEFLKTFIKWAVHSDYGKLDIAERAIYGKKAADELDQLKERMVDGRGVERRAVFRGR